MASEKGELDASTAIGPESVVMWQTYFFDPLLCELIKILNMDECLSYPLKQIKSNLRAGMGIS